MTKQIFVSQSTYKEWLKYQHGKSCGLQFKAKYIDKTYPDYQNESQAAGWWFEDMLIRGKSDVEPPKLKSGKNKGEFNALYRQLEAHLPMAKKMIKEEGKVISSNIPLIKGNIRSMPDLTIQKPDGSYKRIDIKTSGHVGNKFDFYGWGMLADSESDRESYRYLNQLKDKLIQAYTYLFIDTDVKCDSFEFWIFSSNSDDVVKLLINRNTHNEAIKNMGLDLEETHDSIMSELDRGFIPYPNYKRCGKCRISVGCPYKQLMPDTVVI